LNAKRLRRISFIRVGLLFAALLSVGEITAPINIPFILRFIVTSLNLPDSG